MEKLRFPARIYFLFNSILIFFLLFVVARVAFFFTFLQSTLPAHFASRSDAFLFAQEWAISLRADLRLALILILPVAILVWLPPFNPERDRPARCWLVYFMTLATLLCAFYAFDFIFYAQWNQHVDMSVFATPPQLLPYLGYAFLAFALTLGVLFFCFKRLAFWELREDLSYQPPYVPIYFVEVSKVISIFALYTAGLWPYLTPVALENPVVRFVTGLF